MKSAGAAGGTSVLAHSVRGATGELVALHDFAAEPRSVPLTPTDVDAHARVVDMLDGQACSSDVTAGDLHVELEPFGSAWLRVVRRGEERLA